MTKPAAAWGRCATCYTHKHWWECKTGIAYLPGSKAAPRWRQGQSMMIVDWRNPTTPVYLRTHGLPGGQPSGDGTGTAVAARPDFGA